MNRIPLPIEREHAGRVLLRSVVTPPAMPPPVRVPWFVLVWIVLLGCSVLIFACGGKSPAELCQDNCAAAGLGMRVCGEYDATRDICDCVGCK